MAEKFDFELVSPEQLLLSQQVEMVVVPGGDGHFGVLRGHASMLSTVLPGVIDIYESRAAVTRRIFVSGGFAEVTPERCTVLAEEAVPVDSLDRAEVDRALTAAREDLAAAREPVARAAAERAVAIARAKLQAIAG